MTRLQVDGEVCTPRALAIDDLAALPGQIAYVATLVRRPRDGGFRSQTFRIGRLPVL